MGTKRVPSMEERDEFKAEFGIVPSFIERLRKMEQTIVDQKLEEVRGSVRGLEIAFQQVEAKTEKATDSAFLAQVHTEAAAVARKLEEAQKLYNRLIELAKLFGFIPKVYRGSLR